MIDIKNKDSHASLFNSPTNNLVRWELFTIRRGKSYFEGGARESSARITDGEIYWDSYFSYPCKNDQMGHFSFPP